MEEKKVKQVGNITFGICLIAIGIAIVFALFGGFEIFRYLYYIWPLFLIVLGVEVLIGDFKGYKLKWSFWNIFLMGFIICASLIFGFIGTCFHYVNSDPKIEERVKEVIYDNLDIEEDEPIEVK